MTTHLAVVTDTFPCWSERFIARELNELLRCGVNLTVFALHQGALPAEGERGDPAWNDLLPRLRVLPAATSKEMAGGALELMPKLLDAPSRQRYEVMLKALGARAVTLAARARILSRWLREGAFTHVHAHFANWPSTVGWLAACESGLPFTFSAHAYDLFIEPQWLEEKAAYARAMFGCHRRAYDALRALPGGDAKAVLMRHGLPLQQFPFRVSRAGQVQAGNAKPDGKVELLAVGRWVEKKGFSILLEALQAPRLRDRPLDLTILGDGPERGRLMAMRDNASAQHAIRLEPPISGPALRARFESATAFVAPFMQAPNHDQDGIPNVILEAFALGLPVIGTDTGGLPEVLTDATGWVAKAGDVDGLSRVLSTCLDQPEARAERACHARDLIEREYDIEKCVAPLMEAIGVT